jgi:hypothetical protein
MLGSFGVRVALVAMSLGVIACSSNSDPVAVADARADVIVDSGNAVDTTVAEVAIDSAIVETSVDDATDASDGGKTCGAALTTTGPTGTCGAIVQSWPDEGAAHFPTGTALTYCTKPPSSGDHFSEWAAYRYYDKPVPYGYLVHSMEHGAVIVYYKCASGSCPTKQSEITTITDKRPIDLTCSGQVKRRIIVMPDPTLDVEVAASAWGWTYRATCVDEASLLAFIADHYAKSSEDICADGVIPP